MYSDRVDCILLHTCPFWEPVCDINNDIFTHTHALTHTLTHIDSDADADTDTDADADTNTDTRTYNEKKILF